MNQPRTNILPSHSSFYWSQKCSEGEATNIFNLLMYLYFIKAYFTFSGAIIHYWMRIFWFSLCETPHFLTHLFSLNVFFGMVSSFIIAKCPRPYFFKNKKLLELYNDGITIIYNDWYSIQLVFICCSLFKNVSLLFEYVVCLCLISTYNGTP